MDEASDTAQAAEANRLDFSKTNFTESAARFDQCPTDSGWEVAFAGRSNAGKSSAINALTRQKKLARTSRTPGRTQLINFFAVGDQQRLVDLPGYGYAKVPQKVKNAWNRQLEKYLQRRESLRGLILLSDCRHPLHSFDQQMLSWAAQAHMPVHLLLTKADKLSKGAAKQALFSVQGRLSPWANLISCQLFSARVPQGLDELETKLNDWLTDASVT